ncbi:hypothetical protein PHYNN_223 [Pantoea phage Phynn]|nr:hypothetical protein PHYNN_223 [Pantoea phage Phynn]
MVVKMNSVWTVDLLKGRHEFEWPEDVAGSIQSFFVSDRHLYACSASALDLKISPDGIDAPEDETVVCLDFSFDLYENRVIQSSKTNLKPFIPLKEIA